MLAAPRMKRVTRILGTIQLGDFNGFFRELKQADYLTACLMHKHFDAVRERALNAINRAFRMGSETPLPLAKLRRMLCLEDEAEDDDEARRLVEHFGLVVTADGASVLLRAPQYGSELSKQCDSEGNALNLRVYQSHTIIEPKRAGRSMVELLMSPNTPEALRKALTSQTVPLAASVSTTATVVRPIVRPAVSVRATPPALVPAPQGAKTVLAAATANTEAALGVPPHSFGAKPLTRTAKPPTASSVATSSPFDAPKLPSAAPAAAPAPLPPASAVAASASSSDTAVATGSASSASAAAAAAAFFSATPLFNAPVARDAVSALGAATDDDDDGAVGGRGKRGCRRDGGSAAPDSARDASRPLPIGAASTSWFVATSATTEAASTAAASMPPPPLPTTSARTACTAAASTASGCGTSFVSGFGLSPEAYKAASEAAAAEVGAEARLEEQLRQRYETAAALALLMTRVVEREAASVAAEVCRYLGHTLVHGAKPHTSALERLAAAPTNALAILRLCYTRWLVALAIGRERRIAFATKRARQRAAVMGTLNAERLQAPFRALSLASASASAPMPGPVGWAALTGISTGGTSASSGNVTDVLLSAHRLRQPPDENSPPIRRPHAAARDVAHPAPLQLLPPPSETAATTANNTARFLSPAPTAPAVPTGPPTARWTDLFTPRVPPPPPEPTMPATTTAEALAQDVQAAVQAAAEATARRYVRQQAIAVQAVAEAEAPLSRHASLDALRSAISDARREQSATALGLGACAPSKAWRRTSDSGGAAPEEQPLQLEAPAEHVGLEGLQRALASARLESLAIEERLSRL
jgi:hypothetical protein